MSEEMKEQNSLPQWNCELQAAPDISHSALDQFTVGAKFLMVCQGSPLSERLQSPVKIEFEDEKLEYSLSVLDTQLLDYDRAQLIVTGYKPGPYTEQAFVVKDANSGFRSKMTWNIQSVVEQKKTMEQPKPYGPIGPLEMALPLWYWLSWAFAGLFILVLVGIRVKRHLDRKKLLESLARHATALTPINQFNKELRGLARQDFSQNHDSDLSKTYVSQLEQIFRLYLVRELCVPALDWSDRQVLGDIKKRHRKVHDDCGRDIRRLFTEFEKGKKTTKLSEEDKDQLMQMSRELAARVSHDVRMKQ